MKREIEPVMRRLLTAQEVAKIFSVHPETVRRAIRNKDPNFPPAINITPKSLRPRYRFLEDDVYKFIADSRTDVRV